MNPKQLIQVFNNHELGLQERLFRLLVTIGLMGLAMGILVGLVLGESMANTLSLLVVFALAVAITYFSIHFHKIQIGAVLISVLLIYFALPFNFLTSGGIYGGGPIWLMFGVVFVCLVVEKKAKYILIASSFCLYGACYLTAYWNPRIMEFHTIQAAYVDSFFTLAAVTVLVCSMILFQNAMYRKENKIAKEQKKEIEELNRMQNHFFSSMSHEIRTPLNAIVGFSNMLVSDEDLASEEKMEYILIINKNCELLLKLINDILEISRLESGSMSFSIEPCNMNDLIEDVYNTFTLQTPPDVAFLKKTLEEPLCIKTDIVRIKQVLTNFVNNAFKFTCSGSVTIGMENNEEEKEVCIYVEDTGGGIPESQLKMIFNRFYKVNEFAQGTGLGLSICQVIVDKLNGKIAVTSEEGKGSRFSIVLSYADQIENDLPPEIETISHYAQIEETNEGEDRPVVLIAEDSASNYMVLNNILKGYFKVIWVVNGKDALEVVKKRKVDIVLMDIKMHEMDGITAAKKIRKIFKNLPIIFQTAYACDENRELADQAGGAGFITKPVRPDELLNLINQCIK